MNKGRNLSKAVVTAAALIIILVRIIWPQVNVDIITIGLLIMAAIPWLSSWLKALELPGGWKVEFQDVAKAGQDIIGAQESRQQTEHNNEDTATSNEDHTNAQEVRPSYLYIAELDSNLALVGLRIEIERRVRLLAEQHGINPHQSLTMMLRALEQAGIFNSSEISGLRELIYAGNAAAHGASVQPSVMNWAITIGPSIISALDSKLEVVTP